MKFFFTWIVTFFYSSSLLAQSVFIQAVDSSNEQYKGFLESQQGRLQSFVQYYLNSNSDSLRSEKITNLYEQGLKYFFSGSHKMASKHFKEIVSYALDADWNLHQAQMIFQSYLKLSEIYHSQREYYLKQAFNFRMDLDKIPSPLAVDAQRIKNTVALTKWDISEYRHFDYILVNSRSYEVATTTTIMLPKSENRITFLSNTFMPQTFRVYPEQLALLNAPTLPIVEGDCKKPEISLDTLPEVSVFFSKACVLKKKGNTWVSYNSEDAIDNLPTAGNLITIADYSMPSEPIYKKTWFWIAIGVVASAVLLGSKKKDSPPATETITID